MSRFPITLGSLSTGDRFEFKGSVTLTGTVGERDELGIQVRLDITGAERAQGRTRPRLECWPPSMRIRRL